MWHHVVLWHNATEGKLHLVVDDGAVRSSPAIGSYYTDNGNLRIGSRLSADFFTGNVDEFYRWNTLIGDDAAWRTDMYNAGAGRAYPN